MTVVNRWEWEITREINSNLVSIRTEINIITLETGSVFSLFPPLVVSYSVFIHNIMNIISFTHISSHHSTFNMLKCPKLILMIIRIVLGITECFTLSLMQLRRVQWKNGFLTFVYNSESSTSASRCIWESILSPSPLHTVQYLSKYT